MGKKNKKKGKRHRNLALAEFFRDSINGKYRQQKIPNKKKDAPKVVRISEVEDV